MGGVVFFLIVAVSNLNPVATAETVIINNCNDGWGCSGFYDDDRITVFDDRVFDIAPPVQPNGDHPYGKPPAYTAAQRHAWIQKCQPLKRTDFRAFRECFEGEKRKALALEDRRQDEVHKRLRTDGFFYLPPVH
jgi:hypothetical protein